MPTLRNTVSHLPRTASPRSTVQSLHRHFRIASPIYPSQRTQRRTYLLLSTTLNPKKPPQLPTGLPAPPKSIILLTSPDSASSLTVPALSPLTNGSTATILSAIVDSLPGSKGINGSRVNGHSWLITDHTLHIRAPLSGMEPKSLTFSLPSAHFTLSLANTVFQNGQTSTLVHLPATRRPKVIEAATDLSDPEVEEFAQAQEDIKDAWQELGDLMKVVGVKSGLNPPVPLDSIEISIPDEVLKEGNGCGRIYSKLPLRPLTQPRQIKEGMGNILRELSTPKGTPTGASRELEAAVDNYVRSLPDKGPDAPERADVFARLTPQEPAAASQAELLLCPGARLHRVLSGGGGWGNRAGLLSLDPQGERDVPVFEKEFSARFEGRDAHHGGVVQKGQWVQFFVAESAAPEEKGMQFGAVGKVGYIRRVKDDAEAERTLEGIFGGASETGVDVGVAGKSQRMDVPGGVVIVDA